MKTMSALSIGKSSRYLAAFLLSVLITCLSAPARAETEPVRPVGPWIVVEAKDPANVGLVFYFSPDGTFGMVNPKTQVGVAGAYSVGRAGLMINVFGFGKSAEFMGGDVSITGDHMTIDVKRSGFMDPQRVVLQRVRIMPPQPAAAAPPAR
jgi:hypothetical protein